VRFGIVRHNLTIHELGHHWGCEHTPDTIMSETYDFEVSTIDIDKLTSCDFSLN
jgi:predicted Zn-dependent protease